MASVRHPPTPGQAASQSAGASSSQGASQGASGQGGAANWARDRVLYPVPGLDLRTASLSPQEGWVLSRVDGRTNFGELCLITGLGDAQTRAILQALVERTLILTEKPRPGQTFAPVTQAPAPVARALIPSAPPATESRTQAVATTTPAEAPVTADGLVARIARLKKELVEAEAALAALTPAPTPAPTHISATPAATVSDSAEITATAAAVVAEVVAEKIAVTATTDAPDAGAPAAATASPSIPTATDTLPSVVRESEQGTDTMPARAMVSAVAIIESLPPVTAAPAPPPVSKVVNNDVEHLLKDYAEEASTPAGDADEKRSRVAGKSRAAGFGEAQEVPELTSETKAVIFRKHQRLQTDDLFELLEVGVDADKREIKRSYFRLSKEYHPDRHFGRALGPHKEHLSEIFKALSQAMDYLSEDARRSEYRAMIVRQREMSQLERSLELAVEAALDEDKRAAAQERVAPAEADSAAAQAVPTPAAETPSQPNRVAPPPLPKNEAAPRPAPVGRTSVPPTARAQGQAPSTASGAARSPASAPQAVAAKSSESAPAPNTSAPRRLLRQMLAQRLGDQRINKGRQYFDEGMKHLQRRDYVQAASSLKLASSFVPDNVEYKARWKEADRHATELQGVFQFERGGFEERAGRMGVAAECYAKAADKAISTSGTAAPGTATSGSSSSASGSTNKGAAAPTGSAAASQGAAAWAKEAAFKAAGLYLKTRQLERAERYAIMATERAPNDASAHCLLGQILKERKQVPAAIRELERALAIDKTHADATALLTELSGRAST